MNCKFNLVVYSSYIFPRKFICYYDRMQDYPGLKDAIAKTLRNLREAENLSKRQMAQKALLERVYLIQLEKGLRRPSVNALFYISSALNVRPSHLMRLIEEELDRNSNKNLTP